MDLVILKTLNPTMNPLMLQIYTQTRNFYLLQWKNDENVFMNYIQSPRDRENTNMETNLDELLRQRGIYREEYTILNNNLVKSLGSGRADEEEDDDDKEPADVEDDSVEDDKTEDEDKSPDETIKTLI